MQTDMLGMCLDLLLGNAKFQQYLRVIEAFRQLDVQLCATAVPLLRLTDRHLVRKETAMVLSRRAMSAYLLTSTTAVGIGAISKSSPAHADEASAAVNLSVEQWMSAWMSVERPVAGTLHLSRFKDPVYVLLKPIKWLPAAGQDSFPAVEVPKGFVTDFASIPRVFWSALRPDGEYTYPAVIHDYLYWEQSTSRDTADLIFRMAMRDFRIASVTAQTIYSAVRVGGISAWKSNQDQKSRGERRVLQRFPEDPLTTWAEWKNEPGVFE